jgi:hypothetical protein
MVYGELGRKPLKNVIVCRMLNFWLKLVNNEKVKLSSILYKVSLQMHVNNNDYFKWIDCIKVNLDSLGLTNIWHTQGSGCNINWFKNCVKQKLDDQYIQIWQSEVFNSSKCLNYRIFKTTLCYEKYLTVLPCKWRKLFTKFRCRNFKLPIETGIFQNIPREDRICSLCNANQIGDEYHFLLQCTSLSDERERLLKKYFCKYPSTFKFAQLLSSCGNKLYDLCKFIECLKGKL